MLVTMGALVVLSDLALKHTALWYWFPVQYPDSPRIYSLAIDPIPYDIVIIGSSVSHRGLISAVMEEELDRLVLRRRPWQVYNLGMRAATFPAYIEVARNLLPLRAKPRLVILMFTTFNFNSLASNYEDVKFFTTEPEDFFTVFLHAPNARVRWSAVGALLHGPEVCLQAYQLRGNPKRMKKFLETHGSDFHYPFTPEARKRNSKQLPVDRLAARDERLHNLRERFFADGFRLSSLTDLWMHRLCATLEEQHIPFIVLLAPESGWFVSHLYTDDRVQADLFLKRMSAEQGFAYQDLSAPPYRFRDEDFSDLCNHLGPEAAERLSRQLVRLLVAPALLKSER